MIQTSPLQRGWMSCPSPQGADRERPLTRPGEARGLRKNRRASTSPAAARPWGHGHRRPLRPYRYFSRDTSLPSMSRA